MGKPFMLVLGTAEEAVRQSNVMKNPAAVSIPYLANNTISMMAISGNSFNKGYRELRYEE